MHHVVRFGNRWQQNPGFSATFANNRIVGYSHDAAGNLLSDAAGCRTLWGSTVRVFSWVSPFLKRIDDKQSPFSLRVVRPTTPRPIFRRHHQFAPMECASKSTPAPLQTKGCGTHRSVLSLSGYVQQRYPAIHRGKGKPQ
jgi:hypothetical protein